MASIYETILKKLDKDGTLPRSFSIDDKKSYLTDEIRVMPGAKEGMLIFHTSIAKPYKVVEKFVKILKKDWKLKKQKTIKKIKKLVHKYQLITFVDPLLDYIRKNHEDKYVVLYTAVIDPEIAKDEMNTMVTEAGAELLLHTWVTEPIMEGNSVKGVIVESKAGRQALLGKVVIDCTGDGDLLPGTGTETVDYMVPGSRIAQFGFVYWICNVDLEKYDDFVNTQPEKYKEITREITKLGGSAFFSRGLLVHQEGVVWVHRLIGSLHQTDPEEMTYIDTMTRKQSVRSWELLKKYMPGFEKSFIMLSAPQLGTSGGRRIVGEYFLTGKDMDTDRPFEDTIAIFPDNDRGEKSLKYPRTYIPYRALVPKETEGLLVACRAFSADHEFSEFFNLIPHCMCFGQAAGAAAAIAVKEGVNVRNVNYAALREQLLKYGAILP